MFRPREQNIPSKLLQKGVAHHERHWAPASFYLLIFVCHCQISNFVSQHTEVWRNSHQVVQKSKSIMYNSTWFWMIRVYSLRLNYDSYTVVSPSPGIFWCTARARRSTTHLYCALYLSTSSSCFYLDGSSPTATTSSAEFSLLVSATSYYFLEVQFRRRHHGPLSFLWRFIAMCRSQSLSVCVSQ